jgi:Fe-S-cluster-containing hydrogenase component 2
MAICEAKAISRATTAQGDSIVTVNRDKCVGCQSCVVACPFGAVAFFPKLKATKCDLCDGSPNCVEFCFYDCLSFVELSEQAKADRAKKVKALTAKACREIGKTEAIRRRTSFSLEASRIVPLPAKEE